MSSLKMHGCLNHNKREKYLFSFFFFFFAIYQTLFIQSSIRMTFLIFSQEGFFKNFCYDSQDKWYRRQLTNEDKNLKTFQLKIPHHSNFK